MRRADSAAAGRWLLLPAPASWAAALFWQQQHQAGGLPPARLLPVVAARQRRRRRMTPSCEQELHLSAAACFIRMFVDAVTSPRARGCLSPLSARMTMSREPSPTALQPILPAKTSPSAARCVPAPIRRRSLGQSPEPLRLRTLDCSSTESDSFPPEQVFAGVPRQPRQQLSPSARGLQFYVMAQTCSAQRREGASFAEGRGKCLATSNTPSLLLLRVPSTQSAIPVPHAPIQLAR